MGRKKKEFGAKEKKIFVRVTESLHEAIVRSAKKNGLSVSEYCGELAPVLYSGFLDYSEYGLLDG